MSLPADRDLAIALNAHPTLSRPALYRLVCEIPRWLGAPRPTPELALAVGVPRGQMAKALAAVPAAAFTAGQAREAADRLEARIVTCFDADFPPPLRHLEPPPPVLTVRGRLPMEEAAAIVGSRQADAYGREVAGLFARSLAAAGIPVVSGFARGIDAAAHRAALEIPGGRTVAVLGCGLDIEYPRGHAVGLREAIAASGAVMTEFPLGAPPRNWHFPVRNRSIAALSRGVLVVQAALRSGSLVTARHAADLGRDVWAVPGGIFDERALGTNALIREGALLVQHPRDLLDLLAPAAAGACPPALPAPRGEELAPPPAGTLGQVFAALPAGEALAAEELAHASGLSVDQTLGALLELELGGWIRRLPGPVYAR